MVARRSMSSTSAARSAWAYRRSWTIVERVPQTIGAGLLQPRGVDRHLDLEGLPHVAEVRAVGDRALRDGGRLLAEPARRARGQVRALGGEQLARGRGELPVNRLHVVALDVSHHGALRAERARGRRHDDARDVELLGQEARLDGAGAAEGDQGEVARVESVPGEHVREGRVHVGGGHLDHRLGGLVHVEAERLAERPHGPRGLVGMEAKPAPDEVVGVEEAAEEEGVGQRRLGPAMAVAGGPRIGARAARADLQDPDRVEPRDGAAARPDRRHTDHRHDDREVAHRLAGRVHRLGRLAPGRCRRWCRPCRR